MAAGELLGDDQTEHRVAEELQPLVGRKTAVLVGEGAMGDGAHDELVVGDRAEEIDEGREVLVRTGPPGHHSLASASVTASPTVRSRSSSSSAMRNSPGAYGASCSSTISATSTRASESACRSAKSLTQVTDVGSRSRTVATASRTTANTSSRPGRCPAAVPVPFTTPPSPCDILPQPYCFVAPARPAPARRRATSPAIASVTRGTTCSRTAAAASL